MQPLPELRTQTVVRLSLIQEKRVSTSRRAIQKVQKSRARWLLLITDIGVPRYRIRASFKEVLSGRVIRTPMDKVHLGVAFRCS